jgi:trehalose 6-phosphate phosphatase
LTELAAQGHDVLRVAVRSEESPPQLLAAADLVVQGPDEVREFLRRLVV